MIWSIHKYFPFKKILRHDILANTNKKEISLFIFYLVHSLKLTQWITSYFIVYLFTWTSTYIFITKTQYIICQTGEHKTANKTSYVTSHHHRMIVCRYFCTWVTKASQCPNILWKSLWKLKPVAINVYHIH